MATSSTFWVLIYRIVVGLFIFSIFIGLEFHFAAADDVSTGNGGDGGAGISELCDTAVNDFLPPPYGNITGMVCKPVWNTFIIRYSRRNDGLTTIILSAVYTSGWVGIGFSKDGMMVGSSAMVGWFNKKGRARIKQYYLQGTHRSQVIPDKGELPLTNVPPVVALHGPMIYMAFQLKVDGGLNRQPIILALGARYPNHFRLTHHDDKRTMIFDFSGGSSSVLYVKSSEKKNHGISGILGWGLILPVGAIIPRYLKHKDPMWYYLHAVIQLVGFVFALATLLLGIQLYDKLDAKDANISAHRAIGIFILFLCILQILAFFLRPSKDAKIRKYWNWYHHWFGRIALFFGAVNIVLGMQIGYAGNDWKIGYGFLLGVMLISVFVLEILSWRKRSDKTSQPPTFQMNPVQ